MHGFRSHYLVLCKLSGSSIEEWDIFFDQSKTAVGSSTDLLKIGFYKQFCSGEMIEELF
jgi:hypothetical protein